MTDGEGMRAHPQSVGLIHGDAPPAASCCSEPTRIGPTSALASPRLRPTFARMDSPRSKDPLHGVTLKQLLVELVEEIGWAGLAERVDIRCFRFDPSINSSLVFLRRTPWARAKVEEIYVQMKTRR